MAFSQLEIGSSQNFGCVLRDRNQRHDDVFGKNLKASVKEHHHHHHQLLNRVSVESAPSDENGQNRIDSWIENQHKQKRNNRLRSPKFLRTRKDNNCSDSPKQTTRVLAADSNCPKEPVNSPALPPGEKIPRREKPENSKKNENLGASSLVQIWEARLNRSNGGNTTSQGQSTVSSSRSSSGVSVLESSCSGPPVDRESESSADEREDSRNNKAEATENEPKNPDLTVEIEGGSGSVSDSGGSKWVRVADIIRRLSNEREQVAGDTNNGGAGGVNGLPIIRTPKPSYSSCSSSVSDRTAEKSSFPWVTCSPRLRGRQAFYDLLMQLERNRHRELDSLLERNAVSKFSQRGRLQSMLRLRSLQRCLAIQDRHRSNAKPADINRLEASSAVVHLREKFRSNAENGGAAERTNCPSTEIDTKAAETQSLLASTQLKECSSILLEPSVTGRLSPRKVDGATLCKNKEAVKGATESKLSCLHTQETRGTEVLKGKSENEEGAIRSDSVTCLSSEETGLRENNEENDVRNCMQDPFQRQCSRETPEAMSPLYKSNQQDQYLERQETTFRSGWEEQETEEEQEYEDQRSYYEETNYDWFSEISRPRSYWEDLRKYRYLEVMNTRSKEEICQLLERRTVSDFLQSDLREKIDKLMISRVQRQPDQHVQERMNNWELPEYEEEEKDDGKGGEEEGKVEPEEQDRDDDSSQSFSQMFSPSPGRSWSSRDPEISSTPLLPVHNHPSAEMELINDLRAQIEQLQREMSELRNSVKTCMDVNAHLQESVRRDNPLKCKCCVCNETQVESVLYRCGHMCTCLKCAHELQWNNGKCPICRAKILDVVRVFVDSRS